MLWIILGIVAAAVAVIVVVVYWMAGAIIDQVDREDG